MATRETAPERPQEKPFVRFSMRWEGYFNTATDEFLDEFNRQLIEHGLHPEDLVFSGFDGAEVARGQRPRHVMIFAMNEVGWRDSIRQHESNPAEYAQGYDKPCIGLYDKDQLCDAAGGNAVFDQDARIEDMLSDAQADTPALLQKTRVVLEDIDPGTPLREMGPHEPVQESVIHIDYPHRAATDALVGLVFIEH